MNKLQAQNLETTNLRLVCSVEGNAAHFEVYSLKEEAFGTISLYSDGNIVPTMDCNLSFIHEAYIKVSEYAAEYGISTNLQFL